MGTRESLRPYDLPVLVGRGPEQLVIDRLVAGARVGQSGVAVIVGEPGIGKTSLLEYACDVAPTMRVLRVNGSEPEQDVPFAGLLQLLLPALGLLDTLPSPQSDALGVALALRQGPPPDRFAVGAATLNLLSRYAEEQPLLLLIDDAHALDTPSSEAMAFAARRLMADPIALLAASRPEPQTPLLESGLPRIPLTGLSPKSARELAAGQATTALSGDVAERLQQATGGNPLAVVELARDLDAFARLTPEAVPVASAVVTGWFTGRIDALSTESQTALLLAAVTDGDLGVISRAAPRLGVSTVDLEPAEEAGLVAITPGRVRFRHPLVRSAVYASCTPVARRAAHRAVADALPDADHDRRAWHLCEATLGTDSHVATLVSAIGSRALARGANAVAATAFERAALLSESSPVRCRRLLAAGEAAWLAGQTDRARALLQEAATLTSEPAALADIDRLRGNIELRAGSLVQARRILRTAADLVLQSDPDLAAELLCDVVVSCFFLGDAVTGLEVSYLLEELAPATGTELVRLRAEMTAGSARVLAGRPGIEQIRRAVRDLQKVPESVGDRRRAEWSVLGVLFLRETETGRELMRGAVDDLRSRNALATLPNILFFMARDDATTDRWQSARAGYEEGSRLARESGQTTDLVMCLAGLAWLQARTGHHDKCRANAEEVLTLAARHQVHLARAWALFALGELELAAGAPGVAVPHFEALARLLEEIGVLDVDLEPGPELAESLMRAGRAREARQVAERYERRAASKGQPWAMARAQRALAMTSDIASDPRAAERHFQRAVELHALSLDRYEEGRTLLAHGAWLRRARRRVAARPPLRSALDILDGLGARPWADMAAAELRATGETAPRPGDDNVEALTPQELQIARMLGAGRTTREAAAALFLSPKTVEYHLRHVYAKLGVTSRSGLAQAVSTPAQEARNPGSRLAEG